MRRGGFGGVPPPPGFRNLCDNKGFVGKTILDLFIIKDLGTSK
jgi:hypothetical protein